MRSIAPPAAFIRQYAKPRRSDSAVSADKRLILATE